MGHATKRPAGDRNLLTALENPYNERTTWQYNALGRATTMTYANGAIAEYDYDAASRLTALRNLKADRSALSIFTYSYDAVGNRAAMVDPDGGITTYSYDSRNLLSALENPYNERTTWQYDPLGRGTTMTYANGAIAEYDYDGASRLTALRNLKADRSALSIFTYTYDAVGNRTRVEEANGDVVTYSYDEIYQLTRERRSGANAYDTTYTYDAVGNRLTKEEGGAITTYSYDAANQLGYFEDNAGRTTYSYDANGNTSLELRPNGDRVTYTWDIENRQTKVELPTSVVNTITLDGDGKRRTIEDSAGLRKLIWDAENILLETDLNNATAAAYTLAPENYGALISQRRSGATSFNHFDALGSTNKLTDNNAALLIEYLYHAFGQQSVLSGSSANRFTWVGKLGYYRQADADDLWIRARVFNPVKGRWLSRDPIPQMLPSDTYRYSLNQPLQLVDPAGLIWRHCSNWSPWKLIRIKIDTKESLKYITGEWELISFWPAPCPLPNFPCSLKCDWKRALYLVASSDATYYFYEERTHVCNEYCPWATWIETQERIRTEHRKAQKKMLVKYETITTLGYWSPHAPQQGYFQNQCRTTAYPGDGGGDWPPTEFE